MTVQCLSMTQKVDVVNMHNMGWTQKEMAEYLGTSERTIRRVLAEANVITPTERVDAEVRKIKRIMAKYGITVDTLDLVLSQVVGKHAKAK